MAGPRPPLSVIAATAVCPSLFPRQAPAGERLHFESPRWRVAKRFARTQHVPEQNGSPLAQATTAMLRFPLDNLPYGLTHQSRP